MTLDIVDAQGVRRSSHENHRIGQLGRMKISLVTFIVAGIIAREVEES